MIILFAVFAVFDYSVDAFAGMAYDDNIFEYSKMYLEEFMSQVHPERFPFETYDDLRANVDIGLLLRKKSARGFTTTLSVGVNTSSYITNRAKDDQRYVVGLRQSFDAFAVKVEYAALPDHMIRYYRAPGGGDYIGCTFTEQLISLKGTFKPGRSLSLSGAVKREFDDYLEIFDIYDAESYRFELSAEIRVSDMIEPAVAYEFKDLDARGPVPDISYFQHEFRTGILLRTRIPKFSRLKIDYTLAARIFTTEISPLIDALHSGRADMRNTFEVNWRFPIMNGLYLSSHYTYEFRNSYSDAYPVIRELNNYRKWTTGAGVEFNY